MKQSFINGFLATGAALALLSCSSTDILDSSKLEEQQKQEFTANFVKKYGAIDP